MQKNVLLIESDTNFARAMSSALESRGFGVRTSSDGKEGFELARALHPDCVVLCVELPGLSGYSWCNRLKKDGALKGIPLVITSSEATPETFDQHRKLKTRAEDYLLKPFPPETLVDRVGALVGMPEAGSGDEELVTLDDVELDVAPAGGAAPPEEDADLRMLDEAFDSISRGEDEPGARPPGSVPAEAPLTLMPDADEAPALSELDREMEAALASLAAEAAEASKGDPFAPTHAAGTIPAVRQPPTRRIEPRVESVADDETPILLEDVEVLPAVDENAAAALRAAQAEAETLRDEVAALREEAERLQGEAERLRLDGERFREDGEGFRAEAERLREEGVQFRGEADRLRAESDGLRAEAGGLRAEAGEAVRDGEIAALTARLADAGASASARAEELVEASRRTEELERELEAARAAAEGLRAEIDSLRSSADGVRGEAASLQNEVATLRATLDGARIEAEGSRYEIDRLRSEAEGSRSETDRLRSEASGLRAEADGLRSELAGVRFEADGLRAEADGLRAETEALRAEAEARATETSLRIQELEGRAAEHEDRAQRAHHRLKTDEKVREKTRKALAMVLQILEERSAGDGGSGPASS
jgi:CheY-like chemotaxis protein